MEHDAGFFLVSALFADFNGGGEGANKRFVVFL
jgi:hypothetical protein